MPPCRLPLCPSPRFSRRRAPATGDAAGASRKRDASLDDSLFFELVRVVNLMARPFSESIGKTHHLNLNEWRVLLVLVHHPGVAASEVAVLTGLYKMSVSRFLAALALRRLQRAGEGEGTKPVPGVALSPAVDALHAIVMRLALPPAAAVLMLRDRSITSRSSGIRLSPGAMPVRLTIGPGRAARATAT